MISKEYPIKRYVIYCYDQYYPGGGMNDCLGWTDNLDDAVNHRPRINCDCHEVIDTMTGEIIYHN